MFLDVSFIFYVAREDWFPIFLGLRIGLVSASTKGLLEWKCTYTDEDLRIFRASKDTQKGQSKLFILERER